MSGAFAVLVAVVHTVRIAAFSMGHCGFHGGGDDLEGFWLAKTLPLWKFLWAPIDVHRVPLHRLLSLVIVRIAPLDFPLSNAVLLAFHLGGCVFLFLALRELKETVFNYWIVAWYAMNPYFGSQLFWWTAGVARLPYILCANAAAYYYLVYRKRGSRSAFALVILFTLLGFGFFAKSILIVLYLGGLELALRFVERRGATAPAFDARRSGLWALLGVLGILSAVYVLAWRAATDPRMREAARDLGYVLTYERWSWAVFGLGTGGLLGEDASWAGTWLAAGWAFLLGCVAFRARASIVAWVVAAGLISINIYTGTSRARAALVGPIAALGADRYYFELAPILALFMGAALVSFRLRERERRLLERPAVAWSLSACACAGLIWLSSTSYASTKRIFDLNYIGMADSRRFFDRLRTGLRQVQRAADGSWLMVDSPIPADFVQLVVSPKMNSQIVWIMGERPKVVLPRRGAYWITQSGGVYRL